MGKKQKKEKKIIKKKKVSPEVYAYRKKIHKCCYTNNLQVGINIYNESISKNIKLEHQSLLNLISLCDGIKQSITNPHIGSTSLIKKQRYVDDDDDDDDD